MKYINTKTKWVIDIDSPLSGGDWEEYTEPAEPVEEPTSEELPKRVRRKKKEA